MSVWIWFRCCCFFLCACSSLCRSFSSCGKECAINFCVWYTNWAKIYVGDQMIFADKSTCNDCTKNFPASMSRMRNFIAVGMLLTFGMWVRFYIALYCSHCIRFGDSFDKLANFFVCFYFTRFKQIEKSAKLKKILD